MGATINKYVLEYFWGKDWPGDYPDFDSLDNEQKEELLKLQKVVDDSIVLYNGRSYTGDN